MNTSGLRSAALYGYLPNKLGFCGPDGKRENKIIEDFLTGRNFSPKIFSIMEKFKGAYSYYKLIAKKNGIKNFLNKKVVEAYWIGNNLLKKVNRRDICKMIQEEFVESGMLSEKDALKRIKNIPKNSKPHHSFHVFIFGTVTNKINLNTLALKDICRVGWGRVIDKKRKDRLFIKYQPIEARGGSLIFGKVIEKEIVWNKKIIPKIKLGDTVSVHWGMAVEKISAKKSAELKKHTLHTLKLISA